MELNDSKKVSVNNNDIEDNSNFNGMINEIQNDNKQIENDSKSENEFDVKDKEIDSCDMSECSNEPIEEDNQTFHDIQKCKHESLTENEVNNGNVISEEIKDVCAQPVVKIDIEYKSTVDQFDVQITSESEIEGNKDIDINQINYLDTSAKKREVDNMNLSESTCDKKSNSDTLGTNILSNCKIIDIHDSTEFSIGVNDDGVEGRVKFFKNFLTESEATGLYKSLVDGLPWQQKEGVNLSGQKYFEPRMTYWFGKPYRYSSVDWPANDDWDQLIGNLKLVLCNDECVGPDSAKDFNSVMCNYYRDNKDSIGWHADDEASLGRCPKIASISLGQTRVFEMCKSDEYHIRKTKPRDDNLPFNGCTIMYRFYLGNGSLLVMDGSVQDLWLHRVPKENSEMAGRINLTFRHIVNKEEEEEEIKRKKKRAKDRRMMSGDSKFNNKGYNNDRSNRQGQDNYYQDSNYPRSYNPMRNYNNEMSMDRDGNLWFSRSNRSRGQNYRGASRWSGERDNYRQTNVSRMQGEESFSTNNKERSQISKEYIEDDRQPQISTEQGAQGRRQNDEYPRGGEENSAQNNRRPTREVYDVRRKRTSSHNDVEQINVQIDQLALEDYHRFNANHQKPQQRVSK